MQQSILGPSHGTHDFPTSGMNLQPRVIMCQEERALILPSHSVSSHKTTESRQMSVNMPHEEGPSEGRIFLSFLFVWLFGFVFVFLHYHV